MKDDRPPLDPPDDEELRSAAALARALEGGSAEPDLPQAALEAAALLRLSAGAGKLSEERRAQIRRELVEELARAPKAASKPRRRLVLPPWLLLAFPLASAAALSLFVFVRSPEPTAQRYATTLADDGAALPRSAPGAGAGSSAPRASAITAPEKAEADSITGADSIASEESDDRLSRPAGGGLGRDGAASGASALTWRQSRSEADSPAPAKTGAPAAEAQRVAQGVAAAKPSAAKRRSAAEEEAAHEDQPRARDEARALASRAAGPSAAQDARTRRVDDGAHRALAGLSREVGARRTALLARVDDATLRRAHAEADAANGRAELERSQRNLIRTLDTIGVGLDATDVRLVRQDLYCRLAETALRLGEPRAALEWTRHGLDLDGPPTPFLAQLMALEGDAWAALGDDANAAASYMKALRVHEALLNESLDGR
jgi:hypothetical protein